MSEEGPRIVVIGAGVAGAAAALAAARSAPPGIAPSRSAPPGVARAPSGAAASERARPRTQITVLDGGPGASTLATGAVDWTPWRPAGAAPPLAAAARASATTLPAAAEDILDALGVHVLLAQEALLLTTAGVWRPARGRDAALLDLAPLAGRPVGVVRCGRPGWDAEGLVRAWGGACVAIDAFMVRFADERAIPDSDFAARHDDAARLGWLGERLREALSRETGGGAVAGLVLPPSLGVDHPRAQALSKHVGLPCGEPLAMPGGPSGLRFERARDRAFSSAAVERVAGRARRVEAAPAGAHRTTWRVTLDDGRSLDADAVVLATGGLLGGGIEYAPSEAILALALPPCSRAPVRASLDAPLTLGAHGRPLEVPGSLFGLAPEDIAWPFAPDGLLARVGVLVGDGGGCVGAPGGLFAAGELVADAPRTWLCALVGGAEAGVAAGALCRSLYR